MNVLMFGWELPPVISGGLGTACAGLLSGFLRIKDLNTTFVLPRLYGEEAIGDTRLVALESQSKEGGSTSISSYSNCILERARQYTERVQATFTNSEQYNVIHAHDWLTFDAGMRMKEKWNKPLVVHVHSTQFDRANYEVTGPIFEIERAGMLAADKIIVVSNYTKKIIVDHYGQDAQKIEVVSNGVPTTSGEPVRKCVRGVPLISFIGRITGQKGPEYFVDAAYKILQKVPTARFVMAGDGDSLPLIKSLVKSMGMAARFDFPGFLTAADVRDTLAGSDVFIMPSASEPFGIVALEAIDAMVPVVLSTNCGLAELLCSVVKTDPTDTDLIADEVVRLLRDPVVAAQMTRNARAELHHFGWDHAARKVHSIYSELLGVSEALA